MTKMKLISLMLIVAMLALAGCSSAEDPSGDEEVQTTVADLAEDGEATDSDDTSSEETGEEVAPVVELDYTTGLDDNGFHKNIVAEDYVDLIDYKNISVPEEVHTIPDASVQVEIDSLMAYFTSSVQITDRPVADGDTVNIDYVGSVDGVEFEGGSTGGAGTDVTIGVTSYIDDFLAQLIGHTPGESFDITVTFPEDYGVDELNGKDAVFAITLNYITEEILPELTDAFVAENLSEVNQWTTVEEMTTGIHNELQNLAIRDYVQTNLIDEMTVSSIPESVLDYEKLVMLNYYQGAANQYSMTLEEFLAANTEFADVDALYEGYADQIDDVASYSLVIQAIAESADINVTEEDLSDYFLKYNGSSDYSEYEAIYGISYLKYTILQELVLDYLVEHTEIM